MINKIEINSLTLESLKESKVPILVVKRGEENKQKEIPMFVIYPTEGIHEEDINMILGAIESSLRARLTREEGFIYSNELDFHRFVL